MSKRLTLVLGGVRAGKSRYAQMLAQAGQRVLFVATAEAGDPEMAARIQAHQAERPADWDTLEEPLDLAMALARRMPDYDTVLLDCLTLWVSNRLLKGGDTGQTTLDIPAASDRLLRLYEQGNASWIVVSNEVGLGVMPANDLARSYADALGRVNQIFAAAADDVILMVAGVPVNIKGLSGDGKSY